MRDLIEIVTEIKDVCKAHPVMEDRLNALRQAGFDDVKYRYVKADNIILTSNNHGLFATSHFPKKHLYRIQIGYTELKKGYPVAWFMEVSDVDVEYVMELPF